MEVHVWWMAWLGLAPERDLRPVVATGDVDARYGAFLAGEGRPADHLVCTPGWPDLRVCVRVWEGGLRRWVGAQDLARWNMSAEAVFAVLRRQAAHQLAIAEILPVEGTSSRYLRLVDGDGWAAAGLLRPDALSDRLGAIPLRAAVPAEGVLVAWPAGDPELDSIMAVGVREIHDQTPAPVSPTIYTWDGARWLPYGAAFAK